MSIQYYPEIEQGSEEWLQLRCGLLTASEMHLIVTPPAKSKPPPKKPRKGPPPPPVKPAMNNKERAHLWELMSQRISGYVEPSYIGDKMLRGKEDEILARDLYAKHYAPVIPMGFITNDKWGFVLGYSPDGLVGDAGQIECKSRDQKFQVEAISELAVHADFVIQLQSGLLVSEREWTDHITYSGGLPMLTLRVYPDAVVHNAIVEACGEFEKRLAKKLEQYMNNLKSNARLLPTKRRIIQEMYI